MSAAEATAPAEEALRRFAAWLAEMSPRHRALRTPVYLEPEAPRLVRAFWEHVGWSDAVAPVIAPRPHRPERALAEREALKVVQGWLSSPDVRGRWGVKTPAEAGQALRARMPPRSRVVLALPTGITYTDETTGADDPPVWAMDEDSAEPSWPRYARMLVWQTCQNLGWRRGTKVRGLPMPTGSACARPFAPVLDEFWELGPGVWAVGPSAAPGHDAPEGFVDRVLYESPRHYFRYVASLSDDAIAPHFIHPECMFGFGLTDGKALDPEHPSVPGVRRFVAPAAFGDSLICGLVELDGARLWLQKQHGTTATYLFVEPEQAGIAKTFIKREKLHVYQQTRPRKDPFAVEPTAAEIAAARRLCEKARAAAGATTT